MGEEVHLIWICDNCGYAYDAGDLPCGEIVGGEVEPVGWLTQYIINDTIFDLVCDLCAQEAEEEADYDKS